MMNTFFKRLFVKLKKYSNLPEAQITNITRCQINNNYFLLYFFYPVYAESFNGPADSWFNDPVFLTGIFDSY